MDLQIIEGLLSELSGKSGQLLSTISVLQRGAILDIVLAPNQITELESRAKNLAKNLRDIAQAIKVATG